MTCQSVKERGRWFNEMRFLITVSQTCETEWDICFTYIWDKLSEKSVQFCLTSLPCKSSEFFCKNTFLFLQWKLLTVYVITAPSTVTELYRSITCSLQLCMAERSDIVSFRIVVTFVQSSRPPIDSHVKTVTVQSSLWWAITEVGQFTRSAILQYRPTVKWRRRLDVLDVIR